MYICITDKGGRNPTVSDMKYHMPQSHLIYSEKRLTNIEVEDLLMVLSKTRRAPFVVIGAWGTEDEGLEKIIDYDNLNLNS